jgi:hypothetical protein
LSFAGPATEVGSASLPSTAQPSSEQKRFVPTFLSEVVASGTAVTIHFREAIPPDLVLLMPIPSRPDETEYWLIYRADAHSQLSAEEVSVDLSVCPRCDDRLNPLSADSSDRPILPHVFVEVRWEGHSTAFPVRFDEKVRLPLILMGRKPTEAELIEYFLSGKEPDGYEETGSTASQVHEPTTDTPIDTSQILAYIIRRFVQAIPGIEVEIKRAAYSRAPLDAALRGPTSPQELADRAFASLTRKSVLSEPTKTPTAVGFQLTEILAALLRCRSTIVDPELRECFQPVIASCEGMLKVLVSEHAELREKGFRLYQEMILGEPQ